jgi:hypothetical protein
VNAARAIPLIAVLVVVAIVAAAFVTLGPPSRARARALDRRRADDLRSTSERLYNQYHADHRPLDDRLKDPKRDPITRNPYEYQRIDATHYRLCADFELKGDPDNDISVGERWRHSAGRTCYQFDVRAAPP